MIPESRSHDFALAPMQEMQEYDDGQYFVGREKHSDALHGTFLSLSLSSLSLSLSFSRCWKYSDFLRVTLPCM